MHAADCSWQGYPVEIERWLEAVEKITTQKFHWLLRYEYPGLSGSSF